MALLSMMNRKNSPFNMEFDDNQHFPNDKPTSTLSNLFSYSIHNCSCKKAKIGLVLYPKDNQIKNVILLVCDQCYHYKIENGTQHNQLETWYFNIYKDSKSFQFKAKFSQNEDGSLYFFNAVLNTNDSFDIRERELETSEKESIEQTIQKKSK